MAKNFEECAPGCPPFVYRADGREQGRRDEKKKLTDMQISFRNVPARRCYGACDSAAIAIEILRGFKYWK